jgi:hypothetical protein
MLRGDHPRQYPGMTVAAIDRLGVCAAEEMKSGTRFFDLSERGTIDFLDVGKGVGTPENVEN